MTALTIALYQAEPTPRDHKITLNLLHELLQKASQQGVDLLITPELFLSGYGNTKQTKSLALSQASEFMKSVASIVANFGVGLVLAYPELFENKLYNSAIVFNRRGRVLHNYRKTSVANRYERQIFSRGRGPETFEFEGVKCSILICYDVEFPELTRRMACQGTELILVPTALRSLWRVVADKVIPTRAYENGIFIAYCDYAATASSQSFSGASTVCGPDGNHLFDNSGMAELLVAKIETSQIKMIRSDIRFLRDLSQVIAPLPLTKALAR